MPAARATEAVIRNAINAAKECGIVVSAIEVAKDGSVKIIAATTPQRYEDRKPENEW